MDKSRVVNLTYTGCLGGLEHLKIETSLINKILPRCDGWVCVLKVIGSPSRFKLTRKDTDLGRVLATITHNSEKNTVRRKWNSCLLWIVDTVCLWNLKPGKTGVVYYKSKVRDKGSIYKWVSVNYERLNAKTEGSKTSRIHWVEWVNIQ